MSLFIKLFAFSVILFFSYASKAEYFNPEMAAKVTVNYINSMGTGEHLLKSFQNFMAQNEYENILNSINNGKTAWGGGKGKTIW